MSLPVVSPGSAAIQTHGTPPRPGADLIEVCPRCHLCGDSAAPPHPAHRLRDLREPEEIQDRDEGDKTNCAVDVCRIFSGTPAEVLCNRFATPQFAMRVAPHGLHRASVQSGRRPKLTRA